MALRRLSSLSIRSLSAQRRFSALVYANHNNVKLNDSTLSAITAAKQMDPEVHVLVAGHNCGDVANEVAGLEGVSSVLYADHESLGHHVGENAAALIVDLQQQKNFSYIVGCSTAVGKAIMPRAAAALDVASLSDVLAVKSADTFVRPIYAGNALATVRTKDAIKVMTVRTTAFDKAGAAASPAAVETVAFTPSPVLSTWLRDELSVSERPELASASIVVSGGRGVGNEENFKILTDLADHMGAAMGASRAAVDAGYCPNDWQVGQTGKVVAPDVYIAVGISGAIQHLAGMKDSKVIVAINKNADAAIFQVADYGVVGDLFKVVPEFTKLVADSKK